MKSSGLAELKKELQVLPAKKLIEVCIALAKYKKDNKEFLSYLLFDSENKQEFIQELKNEIDEQFSELSSQHNLYYIKKGLRKILRGINRYCKYMGDKALAAEVHIYFCKKIKASSIPVHKSQQLENLYEQEIKKINILIKSLHEDLQNDYLMDLESIT